jgi:hypothetical protein
MTTGKPFSAPCASYRPIRRHVAPWEPTAVSAARGEFPFPLARQALAVEAAECGGIPGRDLHDGMVGTAGDRGVGTEGMAQVRAAHAPPPTIPDIAEARTLRVGDVATRAHKRRKLLVRDLVAHHAKGRDLDLARRLVGLALRATHDEATADGRPAVR